MKKILSMFLFTGTLALATTKSQAQVEVTFGPELGGSLSGMTEDADLSYIGFSGQIGAASHIQFGRFFAVRPSVYYKATTLLDSYDEESKLWLNRVGVNVPLLFSYQFSRGHKLFVGAGPSFSYSLSGKYQDYSGADKVKLSFGDSETDDFKPVEWGLNLRLGFQFAGGLSLGYYYNFGLSNIAPKSTVDYESYKTHTMDFVGITVGWMFGGNKDDY